RLQGISQQGEAALQLGDFSDPRGARLALDELEVLDRFQLPGDVLDAPRETPREEVNQHQLQHEQETDDGDDGSVRGLEFANKVIGGRDDDDLPGTAELRRKIEEGDAEFLPRRGGKAKRVLARLAPPASGLPYPAVVAVGEVDESDVLRPVPHLAHLLLRIGV